MVIARGVIVSGGKEIGEALATAAVSTVMTGGLFTIVASHVSFLDSYVGIINLRTSELMWCNSLRLKGDPSSQHFYNGKWSNQLFYYIPNQAGSGS